VAIAAERIGAAMDAAELGELLALGHDPSAAALAPRLPAAAAAARARLTAVAAAAGPEAGAGALAELLCALRALRNAAAGGPAAADALLALGAAALAADALALVGAAGAALSWELPTAAAQLLANLCASGAAGAAAAWAATFPARLEPLAHVRDAKTQAAAAVALLAAARRAPRAARDLAGPAGAPLLAAMLHARAALAAAAGGAAPGDDLGLLLCHLCLERGLLRDVFLNLGGCGGAAAEEGAPARAIGSLELTAAHSLLLRELAAEAQHAPGAEAAAEAGAASAEAAAEAPGAGDAARFLLELFEETAAACAAAPPPAPARQQVLQDALCALRDVAGRDDGGAALAGGADLAAALHAAGAAPALLAALKALGPPARPRAGAPAQPASDLADGYSQLAVGLAARAARLPSAAPYYGYRSDALAALGNLAHRRPAVQAAATAAGGAELVLACCAPDADAPLAREWGLWAVRNLCEGSGEARAALRELRALAAEDSEELRAAGVRAVLDEGSGRLRVERRGQ
jgi:ataxin-10